MAVAESPCAHPRGLGACRAPGDGYAGAGRPGAGWQWGELAEGGGGDDPMNVLYWVGVGLGIWLAVAVVAGVWIGAWLGRSAQHYPEPPAPPAQCRRAKVLWVDGQPTMSYSIMRRPGHWLN